MNADDSVERLVSDYPGWRICQYHRWPFDEPVWSAHPGDKPPVYCYEQLRLGLCGVVWGSTIPRLRAAVQVQVALRAEQGLTLADGDVYI